MFLRDRGMVYFLPIQKQGLSSVKARERKRALEKNVFFGYSCAPENEVFQKSLLVCKKCQNCR
jgi:hypothetical protein